MSEKTVFIPDEAALAGLAGKLAPQLKRGDVMTLHGTLGAGKTAFARALIQAVGGEAVEVPSPTFTLVQTYDFAQLSIWHFDLYRLEEKEMDVLELGWDEARMDGFALVEWPERLGNLLPQDRLEAHIAFDKANENARIITLKSCGAAKLSTEIL